MNDRLAINAGPAKGTLEILENCMGLIEKLQNSVAKFLEKKRLNFPRYYKVFLKIYYFKKITIYDLKFTMIKFFSFGIFGFFLKFYYFLIWLDFILSNSNLS